MSPDLFTHGIQLAWRLVSSTPLVTAQWLCQSVPCAATDTVPLLPAASLPRLLPHQPRVQDPEQPLHQKRQQRLRRRDQGPEDSACLLVLSRVIPNARLLLASCCASGLSIVLSMPRIQTSIATKSSLLLWPVSSHLNLLTSVQIGSPDGGCKPVIAGNLFQQNHAKITVRHCYDQSAGVC